MGRAVSPNSGNHTIWKLGSTIEVDVTQAANCYGIAVGNDLRIIRTDVTSAFAAINEELRQEEFEMHWQHKLYWMLLEMLSRAFLLADRFRLQQQSGGLHADLGTSLS